jgi:hypothetical protein
MVQTFLVEETKELIYDNDSLNEWKIKCEELGLSAQLELSTKEKSPVPFEFMNTVAKRVYETICPAKVNYKQYAKTAIPLEVLSLIALSEKEGYFKEIQIWYDDKTPDPFAVGFRKRSGSTYDWDYEFYTIARWGDALRPFEELKEMAIKSFHKTQKLGLQSKMIEAKQKLESLEITVAKYFNAEAEAYEMNLDMPF